MGFWYVFVSMWRFSLILIVMSRKFTCWPNSSRFHWSFPKVFMSLRKLSHVLVSLESWQSVHMPRISSI